MISRRKFLKVAAASGLFAAIGRLSEAKETVVKAVPDGGYAHEGARKVPIYTEVDIAVVGGSSAAVAAAATAARCGKSVFLAAPLPYLGEDICGRFNYHLKEGEQPLTPLAQKIFLAMKIPTPLHTKTVLEDELISAGVDFLYSSYATDVLVDDEGEVAGVVIANRSGRQAILAKTVIDATHEALVARLAGARMGDFMPGEREFGYTVVGNTPTESGEVLPYSFRVKNTDLPVTRYSFTLPLREENYAAIQAVEVAIRGKVWDPDQGDSSDLLDYTPLRHIVSEGAFEGDYVSLRKLPRTAFRPKGVDNLWVLGPAAEVGEEVMRRLMRPVYAMAFGTILGEWVATDVKASTGIGIGRHVPAVEGYDYGIVGELLKPLREDRGYIALGESALPVFGSYDVVVMGGGTAGAPAGISAARHGAKTLVLEYLHGLGGLTTLGLIGRYWHGFREGFCAEADKSEKLMASADHPRQHKDTNSNHVSDWKQEWYRRELIKAGGELWLGVIGCGALTEGNKVRGVVVATPYGRGVVLAKVVIDCSGSADVAIAAGAAYCTTGHDVAMQGCGLSRMRPWDHYNNNDWTFIDDTDIKDVSRVFVQAKKKNEGQYDIVKIPQTRERRRVVGDYTVSVYDIVNRRRYSDTISYHMSSFDTHGMVIDPYFTFCPPKEKDVVYDADVPLRSLLPKGLEGIIVTGLGVSADRDAMPVIRMQPCLHNQGYAVGYLAAECVKLGCSLRRADIRKVQRHLVEIGNLPERVLTDKDFKRYSTKELREAAESLGEDFSGLEILLTDPDACEALLEERMVEEGLSSSARLNIAAVLCMLGDKAHASVVAEGIAEYDAWDEGWHYTGMGQFGRCNSRLDALIMALGKAGDTSQVSTIVAKAALLSPEDYFSHFRAVSESLGDLHSPEAAPVLHTLLTAPGMRRHALCSYRDAREKTVPGINDTSVRNWELKELFLAAALYRCGDLDGLGETVLREYAAGLQGHYSHYANYWLKA